MVNLTLTASANCLTDTVIFVFGLCFGSFLNVCIWRIPRKESIVYGRSYCPQCKTKIKWFYNIPIFGWFILKGRCSECHGKISVRYPLIEFITAIIVTLLWLKVAENDYPVYIFLLYLCLTFLFIPTFFIDFKYSIIPNKLNFISLILILILILIFPDILGVENRAIGLLISFSGLILAGGSLYLFNFIGRLFYKNSDVIGMGDIKFISVIGAAFGVYSISWLIILLIGAWLGAVTGGILILAGKKKLSGSLPFGPFLVIAGYIWIFLGNIMTNVYYSFLH